TQQQQVQKLLHYFDVQNLLELSCSEVLQRIDVLSSLECLNTDHLIPEI
ncbi:hypothetical protein L195_g064514, partial [Trifolium pratense]